MGFGFLTWRADGGGGKLQRKLDFFDKEEVVGCRVCSEISFDIAESQNFPDFKEYLQTTKLGGKSKRDISPGNDYYAYLAEKERFCDEQFYSEVENCWEGFAEDFRINTDLDFTTNEKYFVVFVRKDIREGFGTLNTYVMPKDTKNRICQKPLPFR